MFNLVLTVLFAVLLCGCGPMRADELSPSVDTLAFSAADGELLARDVARDRTKTTFARAHARELGEAVDHEAEKLNDAEPAAQVGNEKAEASALADEISTALGQLQASPGDEQAARKTQAQLSKLAERADRLAGTL